MFDSTVFLSYIGGMPILAAEKNEKKLPMRVNYTIVFVSDMARSISFYRDVLGLPMKFDSPNWTEFATEGATLALHKSESTSPKGNSQEPEGAGRCRPGLQVPDIEVFHKRMLKNNVPCTQEPKEIFGVRTAQYKDPDGLVLSVGEAPRNR